MKSGTRYLILVVVFLAGCHTTKPATVPVESTQDIVTAVGKVTEGLTNQNISREDMKRLAVQVQKDPQTQSAVKAVNASFNIQDTCVKYCPIDGKRYSCSLDMCPAHNVKLKLVE